MEFEQLCQAVDAWRGAHDAGALARREAEKLDIASPGRGFSTEVEKLERRQAQQEKALDGFAKKIAKQQMIGHTVYEVAFIADRDGLPLEFIRVLK